VFGADGKFNAMGKDWRYDAYYTHGENTTNIHVQRHLADAALQRGRPGHAAQRSDRLRRPRSPAPMAACRSTSSAGKPPSDAALAYITPENGPYQHSVQKQDVASINLSGEPVLIVRPARCRVAMGAEYRKRVSTTSKATPTAMAIRTRPTPPTIPDPVLSTSGANWFAGNYHSGAGKYNVKEAYAWK
jgi:iron complex outermembrane receptor protein